MALITSAIANGGVLMEPYLVDSVTNYTGTEIDKNTPEEFQTLMTSQEAAALKDYMTSVVQYGTASALSGQSYTAAGKPERRSTARIRKRSLLVCRDEQCG